MIPVRRYDIHTLTNSVDLPDIHTLATHFRRVRAIAAASGSSPGAELQRVVALFS